MLLLYFYIFLGIINKHSIPFYKKKYNSKIINSEVINNEINEINMEINNETNMEVNNETSNETSNVENEDFSNKILCNFYQICIFTLLIYNPIYYLIYNDNVSNIGFIVYKINYIGQYLFLYVNFNKILKYKYLENEYFYNILCIFQIIILGILGIFYYLHFTLNPLFCSDYFIHNLLLIISEFYGIYIYVNSILYFILIFIKLLQDIYILNQKINDNILNNNKKGLIKIFYNIIHLKNIVTYTINDFNHILNIFTLINLFSLGLLYHIYTDLLVLQKTYFYILCGFFIVIETICLSIIIWISKIRTNMFTKIYNPLFVNNFIKKYDINTFNDNFSIELNTQNIDITHNTLLNILEENSTSVDWIILNITLNSKWVNFDLFGFEIYSINCVSKIIFIISIFYKIINL